MTVTRVKGEGRTQLETTFRNKTLTSKVGKVGWFEGNYYPAEPGKKAVPVAYVAAIQEFGYMPKNIPPRPFMRPTIAQYSVTWRKIAYNGSQQVIKGKSTPGYVMEQIGLAASGQIRKTITRVTHPPLKASTIRNRMNKRADKTTFGLLDKPLIDTKRMMNTLINTVEDA